MKFKAPLVINQNPLSVMHLNLQPWITHKAT